MGHWNRDRDCEPTQLSVVTRMGGDSSPSRTERRNPALVAPRRGFAVGRTNYRRLRSSCSRQTEQQAVASRADEYRRRAQQCLEMAGTFREREARATLLRRATNPNHYSSSNSRFSPRTTKSRPRRGRLVIASDPFFNAQSERLATQALRHALPAARARRRGDRIS